MRRIASNPNLRPMHLRIEGLLTDGWETTSARSRIMIKPSGSIPEMPTYFIIAALRITPRQIGESAIQAYSEAIRLNPNYASAFLKPRKSSRAEKTTRARSRILMKLSELIPRMPPFSTTAAKPTVTMADNVARWKTTRRKLRLIPITPVQSSVEEIFTTGHETTNARSKITMRQSGSIQRMPPRFTIAASRTAARR